VIRYSTRARKIHFPAKAQSNWSYSGESRIALLGIIAKQRTLQEQEQRLVRRLMANSIWMSALAGRQLKVICSNCRPCRI
jgi:hypothetical protein